MASIIMVSDMALQVSARMIFWLKTATKLKLCIIPNSKHFIYIHESERRQLFNTVSGVFNDNLIEITWKNNFSSNFRRPHLNSR